MQHIHLKHWSLSTKVHDITFNMILEIRLCDWECLFRLVVLVSLKCSICGCVLRFGILKLFRYNTTPAVKFFY